MTNSKISEAAATGRYSVGVLHYGDWSWTLRCVQSCKNLEPAPEQCIVYSNDPFLSLIELERLLRESNLEDFAEVFTTEQNLGFSGGANKIFELIFANPSVNFALLLNNDAEVFADSAQHLLAALASDDQVAMVGPRILAADGESIWHDGADFDWARLKNQSRGYGQRALPEQGLQETDFVCGCAPMLRRSAWEDVGPLDERFFLYSEDVEYSYRLKQAGWRIAHQPSALIRHEGSLSSSIESRLTKYYKYRNLYLLALCFPAQCAAEDLASIRQSHKLRLLKYRLSFRFRESAWLSAALRDAQNENWGAWSGPSFR